MTPDYRKLKVWQKGIDLCVHLYELTDDFPKREMYSLTDQIRRAGVSVPSNIAAGNQRRSKKAFGNYLDISLGSLAELDTQMIIAERRKYPQNTSLWGTTKEELIEVRKMTIGLRSSLGLE